MSCEPDEYLALLERRLHLLHALARQFVECRGDFIAMNLDGMHGHTAEQESLCGQIRSLQPAIDRLQLACAQQLDLGRPDAVNHPEDAVWVERVREAKRELDKAQVEVGRLNQIHAAYLRRSRRTVNMLMNFYQNYALTYTQPPGSTLPAPRITGES
jgi:hypothetical protein